jgi:drug/metabolite transporter (DMT)-like permease
MTTSPTTAEQRPPISPVLVLGIGLLAVSMSAVLIRFAQGEAPSLVIAAWRTSLASLCLLPFALTRQRAELQALRRRDWGLATAAGAMLGIHFASWISSLEYTSVVNSTVLVTTNPIWVGLAAPFVLKEPLTRPLKIGIALTILGSIVISFSDALVLVDGRWVGFDLGAGGGSRPLLGNGLAVLGAMTAAAYMLIGRQLRPRLSLLSYVTVVYSAASVALLLMVWLSGASLFGYSGQTYLLFALMALFPQLIGHTSFNWALKFLPAAYVSITILGEPIGASILAFVVLRELPTHPLVALLGAILIFGGILVATKRVPGATPPAMS